MKFILILVILLSGVSCTKYIITAQRYSSVDYYDLQEMRYTIGDVIEKKNNSMETEKCKKKCYGLTKKMRWCYTSYDCKIEEQINKTEYQQVSDDRKKEMKSILTEALKTGIQKDIHTTTNDGVVVDVAIEQNINCNEELLRHSDRRKLLPFKYNVKRYYQSGNIFLTMVGKRSNKQNEQLFRITVDYNVDNNGYNKFPSSVCYNEEKTSRIIAQDIFPIAISAIGEDFLYYRK